MSETPPVPAHRQPVSDSPEFGVLDQLRSALLRLSFESDASVEDLVAECLKTVHQLVPFQLVSVYLLNREGRLARIASVRLNESVVEAIPAIGVEQWCRVLPEWAPGMRKSDIMVARQLPPSDPMADWLTSAAGPVTGIVRVPLNGASQTFGVLEAVNPFPSPRNLGAGFESEPYSNRLLHIASALASAISNSRARNEMLSMAEVLTSLAAADLHSTADEEALTGVFSRALEIGLGRLRDYRAAVLRIENPLDSLSIFARAGNDDLSWEGWTDRELRSGRFLAEAALESMTPIPIDDISRRPEMFANFAWLQSAGIRSAACVPMQNSDNTIGTLTIFTGFPYRFSDFDLRLLGALANGFAIFWARLQVHRRLIVAEQSLAQSQMRRFFSLLHTTKNRWKEVETLLSRGHRSDPEAALRIATDELASLAGSSIMDARADEAVDVDEILRRIIKARQPNFRRAHIRVVPDIAALPLVRIPREELSEMINNLLSNAIRAIEQSGRDKGEIRIAGVTEKNSRRDELVLTITDNGVGIPRDRLEKIFEREFTTQQRLGGTGLGLFITRDLVESYGGTIRAESRLGEGASFIIRLPLSWIAA